MYRSAPFPFEPVCIFFLPSRAVFYNISFFYGIPEKLNYFYWIKIFCFVIFVSTFQILKLSSSMCVCVVLVLFSFYLKVEILKSSNWKWEMLYCTHTHIHIQPFPPYHQGEIANAIHNLQRKNCWFAFSVVVRENV